MQASGVITADNRARTVQWPVNGEFKSDVPKDDIAPNRLPSKIVRGTVSCEKPSEGKNFYSIDKDCETLRIGSPSSSSSAPSSSSLASSSSALSSSSAGLSSSRSSSSSLAPSSSSRSSSSSLAPSSSSRSSSSSLAPSSSSRSSSSSLAPSSSSRPSSSSSASGGCGYDPTWCGGIGLADVVKNTANGNFNGAPKCLFIKGINTPINSGGTNYLNLDGAVKVNGVEKTKDELHYTATLNTLDKVDGGYYIYIPQNRYFDFKGAISGEPACN